MDPCIFYALKISMIVIIIIMTSCQANRSTLTEDIVEKITVQVVEAKRHFSDYITRSAHGDCRVVIKRRSRPTAVLVSMDDLRELEQLDKRRGLSDIVGKWSGFEEISDAVENARHGQDGGRDVSL